MVATRFCSTPYWSSAWPSSATQKCVGMPSRMAALSECICRCRWCASCWAGGRLARSSCASTAIAWRRCPRRRRICQPCARRCAELSHNLSHAALTRAGVRVHGARRICRRLVMSVPLAGPADAWLQAQVGAFYANDSAFSVRDAQPGRPSPRGHARRYMREARPPDSPSLLTQRVAAVQAIQRNGGHGPRHTARIRPLPPDG